MGSVTSKREQALVVQPIQTLSTDEDILEKHSKMSSNKMTADQVLEESDFEETGSMSEKSILMTENEIKEMKTITFKSLEKNLYILSDINGHFNEEGFFDEDFVQAAFDLERHSSALDHASLEINHQFEKELGDVFVQFSGVKTACDVVVFCLNKGYYDEENDLIDGVSNPLNSCLVTLLNFTDANARHCHLLVEHGEFLPQILKALQRLTSSHLEDNMLGNDEDVLDHYISIVHNIAQSENSNTELRKIGFVEVLLPYLKSRSDSILLVTLTTLADLVDDSEAKHLEANRDLFKFLLKCLTFSLNDRHRRCEGWSAMELTRTIRRIAKNDVNKKSLVAEGSLPVLVALSQSKHEDEQIEAFGALWVLSFDKDNQDIMLQDDAVMETLIKFRKSQNKKIKNACDGALWNMREKLTSKVKYEEIGYKSKSYQQELVLSHSETKKDHVMISYQWANQKIIQNIRDSLQENGVKCWMDIDDMQGSTLDAMAQAVEGAEIVLICYSKKYQESPSCRAEAEYAFKLRKPIIPLKMERNYEAREWLGLILGSKLFFEFTDKYPFESKMSGLIKEVLSRQRKAIPEKPVISQAAPASTEGTGTFTSKPRRKSQASDAVKKWKQADVLRWINHHNLPSSKFSSLTGIEIAYLQVLRQESPDFFHKALYEIMEIKDILTLAKFSFALDDTLV